MNHPIDRATRAFDGREMDLREMMIAHIAFRDGMTRGTASCACQGAKREFTTMQELEGICQEVFPIPQTLR